MKTKSLKCKQCGKSFEMLLKEHTRQVKRSRKHFFCSIKCGAKHSNAARGNKRVKITKKCPHCGEKFQTMSGAKSSTFCSRSCASSASADKRQATMRKRGNFPKGKPGNFTINTTAKGLRTRESWKYAELETWLIEQGIPHEFEHVVGQNIHDLALFDLMMIIEFDGKEHVSGPQKEADIERDKLASEKGWTVVRVSVDSAVVIPVKAIKPFVAAMPPGPPTYRGRR